MDAVRFALAEHKRCLLIDAHSFASETLPHDPDQEAKSFSNLHWH